MGTGFQIPKALIAPPGAASTRRHYRSHPGTRFPVQAMAGDPAPLIAEPGKCRRRDKSKSLDPRGTRSQDIIFALCSPITFNRSWLWRSMIVCQSPGALYRGCSAFGCRRVHRSIDGGGVMDSKQVVLITGSSTGFGRLMAENLARRGHSVFATMRDPGGRNATNASEIRALAKGESLPLNVLELDVTNDVSVERAVNICVEHAGRIDIAINNAGNALIGLAEAVTTEQAQQIMDTNFFSSVRVNRAVLPHMRRQRSGLLLHISSGAGRLVIPTFSFYCASKFAMESLAEAYHYELAPQGIESSIVEPGAYQTSVFGNIVTAADQARTNTYGVTNEIAAKINGLLTTAAGNPQEVADAVLRIVETPAGERKLRYRVSPADLGVDEINDLCEQVQARLFEGFGISANVAFARRSTAATS